MKINLRNAVRLFYKNPSLEMVYFEAVANAIDAGATEIEIQIQMESFSNPSSLRLVIKDNGVGFNDHNFNKFAMLLETQADDHKGIGRLSYLTYFRRIHIKSFFENHKREFDFTHDFEPSRVKKEPSDGTQRQGATLVFEGYSGEKINTYRFVRPADIIHDLEIRFFPQLYEIKQSRKSLRIKVSSDFAQENSEKDFNNDSQVLSTELLPEMKVKLIPPGGEGALNTIDAIEIHYRITDVKAKKAATIAFCAEGRTFPIEENIENKIPDGYEAIFLVYSDYFKGKVNLTRSKLDIGKAEMADIHSKTLAAIGKILLIEIPTVKEINQKTTNSLRERFPHLDGYFGEEEWGIIDRSSALETAQKKFFKDQRKILDAANHHVSDETYDKSLDMASRVLMEYILYRNITINRLKEVDKRYTEGHIHDLIVPRRKTLRHNQKDQDIFTTNAWLLDERFMTYAVLMSDQELEKLYLEIGESGSEKPNKDARPDIAVVFSNNPEDPSVGAVDVVIIEVKRKGLPLAKNEEVISQLKQRARNLLRLYPGRIREFWFYGITDLNPEFVGILEDEEEWTPLFSTGQVFYKELRIKPYQEEKQLNLVKAYIMSYEALINDAESRNSTFLNLLKSTIRKGRD